MVINKTEKRELHYWIILGIFLLALGLRVVNLAELPLSSQEAENALCALDTEMADCGGSSQIYQFFTRMLFSVFGDSNFSSRLFPALIGGSIILLPFLDRKHLSRGQKIALALFIAIDPVLLQVSRSADGAIIAFAALLFSWFLFLNEEHSPALIIFFFGLLSGTVFYTGLIFLSILLLVEVIKNQDKDYSDRFRKAGKSLGILIKEKPYFFLCLLFLWLLISTQYFTNPTGLFNPLQAFVQAVIEIPTYFLNAVNALPAKIMTIASYSILPLIALLIVSRRSEEDHKHAFLPILISSIAFLLLDLPFSFLLVFNLFVWGAVAKNLKVNMNLELDLQSILLTMVGLAFWGFFFLNLLRYQHFAILGLDSLQNRLLMLAPILILLLYFLFIGTSVSWKSSRSVARNLLIIILSIGWIQNIFHAAALTARSNFELIQDSSAFVNADVLIDEIEQYRLQQGRLPGDLSIAIQEDQQTPAITWLLREYQITELTIDQIEPVNDPDIIIQKSDTALEYSGGFWHKIALFKDPVWKKGDFSGFLFNEILEWGLYRRGTLESEFYSLWFKF